MRGFHETGEFGRRYQCNVLRAPAADDDDFLIFDDLVQDRGKLVAKMRVTRFHREPVLIVQVSCTQAAALTDLKEEFDAGSVEVDALAVD